MIRVGLLGGGGIADEHLRGYRAHAARIGVTAVADPATGEHRAQQLGATAYDDFRTLIAEADVDAVDVCLPHHLHRDAVVAAAAAGRHVLCEKPLCLTAAEAAEVRDAVAASGITLMCAHNQLFLPAVAEAKAVLAAGTIGRVYEVRTTDSFFNAFDPANMGWRANAATSGGGELIDTGYHPTYLLLHLAGGAPAEVTAMLSTHRLAFMEGEDSAQVLVRFDNGVVGQMATSWAYDPAPVTERFSAVGERGSLHSDGTSADRRPARRGDDDAHVRARSTSAPPRSATSPTASRTGAGRCTPSTRGSRRSGSSSPPTRPPGPAASPRSSGPDG